MALDATLNGDVTKIENGAFLAAALNENGEFFGLYALTDNATYVRGAREWIRASGAALNKLNGAQLIEMTKLFINTFDRLDNKGEIPSSEVLQKMSTKGKSASWDQQDVPTAK